MINLRRAALPAVLLTCLSVASASSTAQTPPSSPATSVGVNLNVTPKRLTFNRSTRSATVYIFNQGTTEATFDIAVGDRLMLSSGEIKDVAEIQKMPDGSALLTKLKSAKDFVRITPRRATLAPGKGQTIRILVQHPEAVASAGEYRSHLTVTTLPPRDAGITAEQAASQPSNAISFRIQTVFGLSIPLIVRPAPVQIQASIQNPRVEYANISRNGAEPPKRTPVVAFDLRRSGTGSVFGNLEVRGASGNDVIGTVRGIGVYPEIDHRVVRIPLDRAPRPGEQLTITFTDDDLKPGDVLAKSLVPAA